MRILLQQKNGSLYFKEGGLWTPDATEGREFPSSSKAIEYCMTNHLSGVQVVLKFEEQHYDIVMPLADPPPSRSPRAGVSDPSAR